MNDWPPFPVKATSTAGQKIVPNMHIEADLPSCLSLSLKSSGEIPTWATSRHPFLSESRMLHESVLIFATASRLLILPTTLIAGGTFLRSSSVFSRVKIRNLARVLAGSIAMKSIFEIRIEDYHLCITRLPMNSRAYRMLMNGILVRNDRGHEVIHVLCDSEMIPIIRQAFATFCPEVVERIREIPEY